MGPSIFSGPTKTKILSRNDRKSLHLFYYKQFKTSWVMHNTFKGWVSTDLIDQFSLPQSTQSLFKHRLSCWKITSSIKFSFWQKFKHVDGIFLRILIQFNSIQFMGYFLGLQLSIYIVKTPDIVQIIYYSLWICYHLKCEQMIRNSFWVYLIW